MMSKTIVYVSAAIAGTIGCYELDEASGTLTLVETVAAAPAVMPMAVAPDRRHLYAIVRSQPYRVITYAIDPATGALTQTAVAALPDSMPYASVDGSGRLLFLASYDGDKIASLPIDADGRVTKGVWQMIPTGRNAHCIVSDATGSYAFAAILGADAILQFVLDAETGTLLPNDPPQLDLKHGQGPRHLAVAPDNKAVYVLTELTGEVVHLALDPATGLLTAKDTVSALPPGADLAPGIAPPPLLPFNAPTTPAIAAPTDRSADKPRVWAADICLTPGGRFLYTSERRTSTITAFEVAPEIGKLSFVESYPTEQRPRALKTDPIGRFLIVAGEKSGTLAVYEIDPKDGTLVRTGSAQAGKGASWIEIVSLPQ